MAAWDGGDAEDVQTKLIKNTLARVELYNKALESGGPAESAFQVGVMLHYLEDTWTPSYSTRKTEGVMTNTYDYATQSPKLHGQQGNPDNDSPVMRHAVDAGAKLLKAIQTNRQDREAMKKALLDEIYPMTLDQNAPNPYTVRATWDDVRNSAKPVIDNVTQKVKRGSDALMMELEPLLNSQ